MTEVVYIMACNYSYCGPKLPLLLPTHQLVYHADQTVASVYPRFDIFGEGKAAHPFFSTTVLARFLVFFELLVPLVELAHKVRLTPRLV